MVDERYQLTIAEIWELTDREIVEIYLRPRDKEGRKLTDDEAWGAEEYEVETLESVERLYVATSKQLKKTPAEIEAGLIIVRKRWREQSEGAKGGSGSD